MAAAPGLPCEVRAGDDRLAQLCGCNMAITKAALHEVGGFDPMFTAAGDDVDLSWRLAESNETLAYAPGAIVIHDRRATLSAYLRQQRGYGGGEGLLYRHYPLRTADDALSTRRRPGSARFSAARESITASSAAVFSRPFIRPATCADLPLTIQWVACRDRSDPRHSQPSARRTRRRRRRDFDVRRRGERRMRTLCRARSPAPVRAPSSGCSTCSVPRSKHRARAREMAIRFRDRQRGSQRPAQLAAARSNSLLRQVLAARSTPR